MSAPGSDAAPQRKVVVLHDGVDEGTRIYAEWLGEDIPATVASVAEAAEPSGALNEALLVCDTVVVVSSIMTPSEEIGGASYVLDNWEFLHDFGRRVAMAVVGLSPVFDYSRLSALENGLGADKMTQIKFFQLRGKLDTSNLGMRDKLALRAQVAALKARPRRAPDEQAMLDNGGNYDYTNRRSLAPLLRWVRGES